MPCIRGYGILFVRVAIRATIVGTRFPWGRLPVPSRAERADRSLARRRRGLRVAGPLGPAPAARTRTYVARLGVSSTPRWGRLPRIQPDCGSAPRRLLAGRYSDASASSACSPSPARSSTRGSTDGSWSGSLDLQSLSSTPYPRPCRLPFTCTSDRLPTDPPAVARRRADRTPRRTFRRMRRYDLPDRVFGTTEPSGSRQAWPARRSPCARADELVPQRRAARLPLVQRHYA